jgi:drug/metabolite transporter (DMT)-like permease
MPLQGYPQAACFTGGFVTNPIVAVILGFFFLGESITWTTALGIAVVLFGAWLGNRPNFHTDSSIPHQEPLQKQCG